MGRLMSRDARQAKHDASVLRDVKLLAENKGDWAVTAHMLGARRANRLRRRMREVARMRAHAAGARGPEVAK